MSRLLILRSLPDRHAQELQIVPCLGLRLLEISPPHLGHG